MNVFGGFAGGQEAAASSVPAAIPAQEQSAGPDPYALIANIVSPGLATAATTPIAGAHGGAVPSSLQRPIAPHQDRPMNQRPVVGRKAARIQGIGNAITGATNAIGAVVTKEAQMKQDQIRDAATKFIMAQQGIDEAKQAHDAAIANGDAATASKMQELIQKNTQARDGITADPKMRKALAKGFDISYTDPESNKTEEHAAVQAAIKQAKTFQEKRQIMQQQQEKQNQSAATAFGQAYEKQAPQGTAANVPAQQRLAIAQATQKELGGILRSTMSAQIRADASTQNSIRQQQTELVKQTMQLKAQDYERMQRLEDRKTILGISNYYATRRMWQEVGVAEAREKAVLEARDADPNTIQKEADTAVREWDGRQQAALGRVDAASNQLSILKGTGVGPGDGAYDAAQATLDQANLDLQTVQDHADHSLTMFNLKLASVGEQPIPGPATKKPGASDATGDATKPGTGNNFWDYTSSKAGSSLTAF